MWHLHSFHFRGFLGFGPAPPPADCFPKEKRDIKEHNEPIIGAPTFPQRVRVTKRSRPVWSVEQVLGEADWQVLCSNQRRSAQPQLTVKVGGAFTLWALVHWKRVSAHRLYGSAQFAASLSFEEPPLDGGVKNLSTPPSLVMTLHWEGGYSFFNKRKERLITFALVSGSTSVKRRCFRLRESAASPSSLWWLKRTL